MSATKVPPRPATKLTSELPGRTIHIEPKKFARKLVVVVAVLLGLYILSGLLNKIFGVTSIFADVMYYAFDMDGEVNVPAAFSFLILSLASFLLLFLAFYTSIRGHKKFWIGLSFIFAFLACDEFMQIHEHLSAYLKENAISSVGGSNFVWVLPYGIFALVVGLFLFRFVMRLPAKTRKLFFLSGFIYVFSALFIDYVQGITMKQDMPKTYYKFLTCIEEPGEMIAIILFIYALLDYMTPENGTIQIRMAEKQS